MIETAKTRKTGTLALIRAGQTGWPGDDAERVAANSNAEYYRAYYRALVEAHSSGSEDGRGLEAIKRQRRKVRRERWMQGLSSLA